MVVIILNNEGSSGSVILLNNEGNSGSVIIMNNEGSSHYKVAVLPALLSDNAEQ